MKEAKNIKDYLPMYIGCRVKFMNEPKYAPIEGILCGALSNDVKNDVAVMEDWNGQPSYKHWSSEQTKLILRPLSEMTQDEFKEISTSLMGGVRETTLVFDFRKDYWICAIVDEDYLDVENSLSDKIDISELIIASEDADYDNVLSYCMSSKVPAYGTSDEMRWFLEPEKSAEWHRQLFMRGFDLFDLIKNGIAIDAKTLTQKII